jgi:hypothetical protein
VKVVAAYHQYREKSMVHVSHPVAYLSKVDRHLFGFCVVLIAQKSKHFRLDSKS